MVLDMEQMKFLNFNKPPMFLLLLDQNGQVKPIVSADGRIVEVIIENIGSNYTSIPDLIYSLLLELVVF